MSMLVSDYDGTFNGSVTTSLELNLNIKAVREYMEKGNTFVIATGRAYTSIKGEINRYDIPYDYLICNDGSTVFEKNELLHSNGIENDRCKEIISMIDLLGLDYTLFDSRGITRRNNDIVEIAVLVKNIENYRKIKNELSYNFSDLCIDKLYRNAFIRKDCRKDYGIEVLCNIVGRPDNIYTVGNDTNDIEMLKKYDGYRMLFSNIHEANIKTSTTVHSLIKKISK